MCPGSGMRQPKCSVNLQQLVQNDSGEHFHVPPALGAPESCVLNRGGHDGRHAESGKSDVVISCACCTLLRVGLGQSWRAGSLDGEAGEVGSSQLLATPLLRDAGEISEHGLDFLLLALGEISAVDTVDVAGCGLVVVVCCCGGENLHFLEAGAYDCLVTGADRGVEVELDWVAFLKAVVVGSCRGVVI